MHSPTQPCPALRPTRLPGLALLLLGLAAPQAYADTPDRHALRTASGAIVRNAVFDTCVRTKWLADQDPCAIVQQVAVRRTVLEKEERTVYFAFDSARLAPQERRKLDSVAQKLRKAEDVQSADIVGFADRLGSVSYNEALSRRRAEAVKRYLAERGYLNTQVAKVRGLGETQSVTNCDPSLSRSQTIDCLSPDRRVELEIRYLDEKRSVHRQLIDPGQ